MRIDAPRLRARVIGEGGNLGLTQAARIEYSLAGGLVNTDFIDNSAGVDTSDHEVNIKILLADAIRAGVIPAAARHQLLHEMTDEVAALVLRHNYRQNMALAAARSQASSLLHVHARYLRKLVRDKRLDPEQDVLPGDREIAERRSAGGGLTTPEFALLLAHTKISADEEVLASGLPDDPYLRRVLDAYFPGQLRAAFADQMEAHPLRREIITTSVVNEMIDTSGTTFLFRLNEETGASVPNMTRAWLVARDVFDMPAFWRQVEELEGQVSLAAQITLLLEGRKLTERAARWLLHNRRPPFDIAGHRGLLRGRGADRAGRPAQAAHRPGPGRVRGAPGLLPGPGRAAGPGRAGRGHGADVLRLRHRAGRRQRRAAHRGDRRGLLRPGRPAADHPAAGPHHRAAPRGPLVDHGPRRPARRPVRRARGADPGRARGQRLGARPDAGGAARGLGVR